MNFDQDISFMRSFPADSNIILTDPRGVGCNSLDFPTLQDAANSLSTENFASDILAIINDLKLDNYILVGTSYGTVLATVTASRAEAGETRTGPKSVVLISTLGHSMTGAFDPYVGFSREWQRLSLSLDSRILSQLAADRLPFDLSEKYWGLFITAMLVGGHDVLKTSLEDLVSSDSQKKNELKTAVQSIGDGYFSTTPPLERQRRQLLNKVVSCREFGSEDNVSLALSGGKLVSYHTAFCDGLSLTDLWDAAEWPVKKAHLYYVQGDEDPATYMEIARYHFEAETLATRSFISVHRAAHAPELALGECWPRVLKSISNNGFGLKKSLLKCPIQTHLETHRNSNDKLL
jgi:pimeloyl-ACP methyl ester carboxylesterase